jgi:hypothetical protein
MTEHTESYNTISKEDRARIEEFALGGIDAALEFADLHDLPPSRMLAGISCIFWSYLLMISTKEGALVNIDNALKSMHQAADETRNKFRQLEWAERMTHGETGHA